MFSEELRPLSDFTGIAFKLTTLMCLAINATVTLKNLVAKSSEIKTNLDRGDNYEVPIYIYYRSIPFSKKPPNTKWVEMLFNYKAISSDAQDVFNKWISAYDNIAPALNLYFSTTSDAQKYLDGKFLALAQGLETYHRSISNEKSMDPEEYEILVAKVIDNCPKEKLEWLNGRLMHGNEINLRKRLRRIIEPFKTYIGNNRERERLIKSIVDTRNYLTHYNENLMDSASRGSDLGVLCERMEAIFQLHFLKVIGLKDEQISSIIQNCYALRRKL